MKIDNIELDSFKIRIPINKVNILDESVYGAWILVNEKTGIVDEADFKKNSVSYNINGIKTKFALEKQTTKDQSIKTYLIILINSKILQHKYFEGITKLNIKKVYKYLISLNVAEFTFNDFMDSEITDADFKRDRIQANFKNSIDELYSLVKPSKNMNEGCRKFKKKNNIGIQFSDRRTTAIQTSPFLKIYHKEIELKKGNQQSRLFYQTYLHDIPGIDKLIQDRIRVEFTIKNKKHFKLFNIPNTSLRTVLSIHQKNKKEMMVEILKKHLLLEMDIPVHKKIAEIKPTDLVIVGLIQMLLGYNVPMIYIIETVINRIKVRQHKSRMRIKLWNLYHKHNFDEKKHQKITRSGLSLLSWLLD